MKTFKDSSSKRDFDAWDNEIQMTYKPSTNKTMPTTFKQSKTPKYMNMSRLMLKVFPKQTMTNNYMSFKA